MESIDSKISLIAAIGAGNRALGKDGQLLWQIPDDLRRFKMLTSGHPVIMGRKTWESLPEKFRPLPGRMNVVITRQKEYAAAGAHVLSSLEEALATARTAEGAEEIFIIGGGQLYTEALSQADILYLTLIGEEKEGDVFFPPYENRFTKILHKEERVFGHLHYTWVDLTHK